MNNDRSKLPFRKNCEGYFVDGKGNVLARKTEYDVVVFPGGGVDDGEDVDKAIIRETFEETGAIVKNIKKLGNLKFVWSEDWAQTEKQKKTESEQNTITASIKKPKKKLLTNNRE